MEVDNISSLPFCYAYRSNTVTDDMINLELFIKQPLGESAPRRFRLNRPSSESVSSFFDRLIINTNKTFSSILARKKKAEPHIPDPEFSIKSAKLYRSFRVDLQADRAECAEVDSSLALGTALFSETSPDGRMDEQFLKLYVSNGSIVTYRLFKNPAVIHNFRLELRPMVNIPIVPRLETSNMSVEKSEFRWFVSENGSWSTEPVHIGLIFIPKTVHANHRLRLIIRPRDSAGRLGLPYSTQNWWAEDGDPIESKWPIAYAPEQQYISDRLSAPVIQSRTDSHFRVISYNILADMYASLSDAQKYIFRHCPTEFLAYNYRLPLILHELLSYQGDLICLQEVDKFVFDEYLRPILAMQNLEAVFVSKRKIKQVEDAPGGLLPTDEEKGEGCAIFYRTSRFKLVQECHLPSILAYANKVPSLQSLVEQDVPEPENDTTPSIFQQSRVAQLQKARAHCLAAALFRSLDESGELANRLLLVGNAHFYFHPTGDHLRLAQASCVKHHLVSMAKEAATELGLPVSIIFCGDINQSPHGTAYKALTGEGGGDSCQLRSAYSPDETNFTNWVPGFRAVLDVILYSTTQGLHCKHTLPLCSQKEIIDYLKTAGFHPPEIPQEQPVENDDLFALPNFQFPSDHLSLVADFDW